MSERTLAIIKPDAVRKHAIGDILSRYENAGLRPVAMKLLHMAKPVAEGFYAVHKARPFFDSLCTFMSSGPSVVGCRSSATFRAAKYLCSNEDSRARSSIG